MIVLRLLGNFHSTWLFVYHSNFRTLGGWVGDGHEGDGDRR